MFQTIREKNNNDVNYGFLGINMNTTLKKQLIRWCVSCFIMSFISEIIDWNTWLFVGAFIAFLISLVICDSETEKQKELEKNKTKNKNLFT